MPPDPTPLSSGAARRVGIAAIGAVRIRRTSGETDLEYAVSVGRTDLFKDRRSVSLGFREYLKYQQLHYNIRGETECVGGSDETDR